MRKKGSIVAVMMVASILTLNALPVNAEEAKIASLSGGEVLQSKKVEENVKPEKITKSKFMDELKNVRAEFPEANLNEQLAEKEFDLAVTNQNSSKAENIVSDIVKEPTDVYKKVKDDGSTLTLKVYSASSWETTKVTPGSRSGNYYTGTRCEVMHINNCTTLGVTFRADHTTSSSRNYVDRTYNLFVTGFPDFATGIGVSVYRGSGSFAKINVTGHDLNLGIQLFHGMIVFHPEDFSLYTSYVWD